MEQIVSGPVPPINESENYGITREALASFRSRSNRQGNYHGMKLAYYGIQNMVSSDGQYLDLPHEMLVRMKPADIVALYIGIGEIRTDGHYYPGDVSYKRMVDTSPEDFSDLISELVKIGYSYAGTKAMSKKLGRDEPGGLKARM